MIHFKTIIWECLSSNLYLEPQHFFYNEAENAFHVTLYNHPNSYVKFSISTKYEYYGNIIDTFLDTKGYISADIVPITIKEGDDISTENILDTFYVSYMRLKKINKLL